MTVNIPLLRKAVSWVEEQASLPPELSTWEQGEWLMPADKRARRLAYSEVKFSPIDQDKFELLVEEYSNTCGTAYCVAGYIGQLLDAQYAQYPIVDGVHVSDFAADALGLTADDADMLFDGVNTAEDVRRIAEEIAGERL